MSHNADRGFICKKIATVALVFLLCSCVTPYVWEHTDPSAMEKMPDSEETRKHIDTHQLNYSKDPESEELLVEQTTGTKAANYCMRIVGIPVAVLLDTVGIVLIGMGQAGSSSTNPSVASSPAVYHPSVAAYQSPSESQTMIHAPSGVSASKLGNTTYFSDGTTARQLGNTTYYSDGESSRKIGNTTYHSDGETSRQIGNTLYNSDGSTVRKIGNTTYGSDGSSCRQIGSTTYCN